MKTRLNHSAVNDGDAFKRLLILPRHDFHNRLEALINVTRHDALGGIPELKINPLPQARRFGERRAADFPRNSWVNCGLEYHHGAPGQTWADGAACTE